MRRKNSNFNQHPGEWTKRQTKPTGSEKAEGFANLQGAAEVSSDRRDNFDRVESMGISMGSRQATFLSKVAHAIPRLFKSLEEGNVRAEWILGLRHIRSRQARLKLVAELVDPGENPLKSHGSRNRCDKETEVRGEPK